MKVVFLDIDGVLNNPGCYAIASGSRVPAYPPAIEALNHITDTTGAKIVVSSTWRLMGLMECREKLREWGVTGQMIGATPREQQQRRGYEIGEWLTERHVRRSDVEAFVILDDDNDMAGLSRHLVQTQGSVGLTMTDAEKAIAVLNLEPLADPARLNSPEAE